MLSTHQLREQVIRPVLLGLGHYHHAGEELLLFTAAAESGLRYLAAPSGAKRYGLWGMTPAQHDDICTEYLAPRRELAALLRAVTGIERESDEHLPRNLAYACALAWCCYHRAAPDWPDPGDAPALAALWRAHYHTADDMTAHDALLAYAVVRRAEAHRHLPAAQHETPDREPGPPAGVAASAMG